MNKQWATAEKKQWKTRKGEKNEEELMKKKVPKKPESVRLLWAIVPSSH